MKKLKLGKFLGLFAFFMMFILVLTNNIFAVENREDLIKKIAPDGKTATFKVKRPTSPIEGDFVINCYINNLFKAEGYNIYGGCHTEPYDECNVVISSDDYESKWDSEQQKEVTISGWKGEYNIKVTYDEPKTNSTINGYISKLNNFKSDDPSTYYIVDDLSLINYYLTSDKSELWNQGAPGRALKYSTINNVTNGSNVTYYLDVRAGNQDESLMYESAFGPMSIFYNGYSYETKEEGVYLKRVLYIPEDTKNTTEAYVAAAQKRINDYLGNSTSVSVTYGGKLSSLAPGSEDEDYKITSDDGNYYNIKVGTRTYKFYILKGSSDKLVAPIYLGTDIDSKIEVTSQDSTIPLDTSLSVKNIIDSSIKDKIGTENYKSYDISLYSEAQGSRIEKLENGKFSVKIPVPTELDGKQLIVYYITSERKLEEHEVIIKDGYATFETNHFSVYTLAEKTSSAVTNNQSIGGNPKTGDSTNLNAWFALFIISGTAFICIAIDESIRKRRSK